MKTPLELVVHVPQQELRLLEGGQVILTLPISTSKFGLGTEEGSNCTPLGRFYVCEKYGQRAPIDTFFKGRQPAGTWSPEDDSDDDFVMARILRLTSDDPSLANTYRRYIYMHGTNQESLLGSPASHGCVRLSNQAIADLYPRIPVGTPVTILNELSL